MIRSRYLLILPVLFFAACAQISTLTGGREDVTAPAIDSARTSPYNGQTHFEGDEVKIRFNEYIALNKPSDNIIITPRPLVAPIIKAHNKTLTIIFLEPLADNTTYTISFNRAVTDITEKNDSVFQYVFSTGSYIDSLYLPGLVTDAYTNTGAADYLVALYPVEQEMPVQYDSVPYKLKPVYIGQTDDRGRFRLNYLKAGEYYIFAFDDRNRNLLLEPDEAVAFVEQRSVSISHKPQDLRLKAFRQAPPEAKIYSVSYDAPGRLTVVFTSPPDSFDIQTSMPLLREETGKRDSLVYWLSGNPEPKMRFVVQLNGEPDTLKPLYKQGAALPIVGMTNNVADEKILPDESLRITFSEPVAASAIDTTKIRLISPDSVSVPYTFEIRNARTMIVSGYPAGRLTMTIDSAAITSVYGNVNKAKQTIVFENHPASYYGSLVVNTDSVFAVPAIVYVLDAKGEAVDSAAYAPRIYFEKLVPADYQLQLILDENSDGEWTSGSLKDERIPEKVIYFNGLITIKSKWEKEVDWLLKESN